MHLLIDLDGTLTDPFPGITRCIRHALLSLDRKAPPAEELRWCIGPPLQESFTVLLGIDGQHLVEAAIARYREQFSATGLFENEVYPGIADALEGLTRSGHTLHVATSKPEVFATRIVERFGLARHFHTVFGSELDGTRSDKGLLIAHILQQNAIDPHEAFMIGDRKHDVIGARHNGVQALGVLWGYGSQEELEEAGAEACLDSPEALLKHIRQFAIVSGHGSKSAF